jgi:hypothetical protein
VKAVCGVDGILDNGKMLKDAQGDSDIQDIFRSSRKEMPKFEYSDLDKSTYRFPPPCPSPVKRRGT